MCTRDLIRPKRIKMSCTRAAYRPPYMGVLWRRWGVAAEAEVTAGRRPPQWRRWPQATSASAITSPLRPPPPMLLKYCYILCGSPLPAPGHPWHLKGRFGERTASYFVPFFTEQTLPPYFYPNGLLHFVQPAAFLLNSLIFLPSIN